jgi:phosphinothricin acetyltransferase
MNARDTLQLCILPMQPEHWPDVERIYVEGIATGNATFETESPGWENWGAKHFQHSRLVALEGTELLGWAALSGTTLCCSSAALLWGNAQGLIMRPEFQKS